MIKLYETWNSSNNFTWRFQILCILQEKRISAADALAHPYLDEGRLRYHSCMCKCCRNTPNGRQYTSDFEPACSQPFSYSFETDLTSTQRVKGKIRQNLRWYVLLEKKTELFLFLFPFFTVPKLFYHANWDKFIAFFFLFFTEKLHKFIVEQPQTNRVPLCINPNSVAFKSFAR